MARLVKTTILIPEDVLMAAKFQALEQKTSLSKLIAKKLSEAEKLTKTDSDFEKAMKTIGTLKIGIKKAYEHREDIYNEMLGIK